MDPVSSGKAMLEWSIPILDSVPVLRGILGILLVFFAPGFAWSLVLFRNAKFLERIAVSFGLSIAMVTVSVLALNYALKIPVTGLNSTIIILVLTAIPFAVKYSGKLRKKTQPEGEVPEPDEASPHPR